MRRSRIALLSVFGLLLPVLAQAGVRELTDATGAKVLIHDDPKRIVTLAPSLGELVAELAPGRTDRIVGVSDSTDFPAFLSKIKSIGSYHRFNLEAVAALRPDLVLATWDGNSRDQVEHLRELGIPVVVIKTESIADIEKSIRMVAQAIGAEKEGAQAVSRLRQGLAQVEERTKSRKAGSKSKLRVLIQLDWSPLIVAGKDGLLNEVLGKIGVSNVYADATAGYPRPSVEDAIHRDPDVILVLGMKNDMIPVEKAAKSWRAYSRMKAVRSAKIKAVPGDRVLRPTLGILEGFKILEEAIYGPAK